MIQEFQIRVLPEQAANEQSLKQFIGHDKGLDIRTIHALRILKRSIDARQRTIYVNLKVRLYINEVPQDEEFTRTIYNKVDGKATSHSCRSRSGRTVCSFTINRVRTPACRSGTRKECTR